MDARRDSHVASGIDPLSGANARIGAVLCKKYRLDRILGIGGTASVYAATHLRNAHRVAVKVLHPEVAANADLRARFLREGYAANSVEHPGTVRVLDDDTAEDGSPFLVMELLDGETLDARWERSGRKLGAREVVALMADLLDVLAAAHAKGIVHRDIKPENLFLTREGRLKVLDFGVARLRENSLTQTRAGALFGTPAFMAPEQALGRTRDVDALSDVWAVGATAFSLLSGQFVHPSETVEEMLVRTATQRAPLLASVAPHVPSGIAQVIDRALAFERADRWEGARAMQDALARASEHAWLPVGAEAWADDAKTRLAPPPQLILRGEGQSLATSPSDFSASVPTLPVASTVAGVASQNEASRIRRGRKLVGATAGGLLLIVVVGIAAALVMGFGHSLPTGPTTTSTGAVGPANANAVAISPPVAGAIAPPALPAEALPLAPPVTPPRSFPTASIPVAAISTAALPTTTIAPTLPAASQPLSPPKSPPLSGCNPPYVLDAKTGHKRWRDECL